MRHGRDELEAGRRRAENTVAALEAWASLKAVPVRALKRSGDTGRENTGEWKAVGEASWVDVYWERDGEYEDRFRLLIVNQDGNAKACSCETYDLLMALILRRRVQLPTANPGNDGLRFL